MGNVGRLRVNASPEAAYWSMRTSLVRMQGEVPAADRSCAGPIDP